jgi:hypothetical protein
VLKPFKCRTDIDTLNPDIHSQPRIVAVAQ